MALKGCNRKRIYQLITFPRTEVSLFWLTKNTILHFTWLGLPQECDHESLPQWHNVYQQLPVFTTKRQFCSLFFCCCWTFPYLLSKVPCSLSEFISVICLTTCVDLFGLTNKGTWLKSLTFGAKIKCHAYLWICGLPVYLNKLSGQSTIDCFSKNRLINKLIIIVSTEEKKRDCRGALFAEENSSSPPSKKILSVP